MLSERTVQHNPRKFTDPQSSIATADRPRHSTQHKFRQLKQHAETQQQTPRHAVTMIQHNTRLTSDDRILELIQRHSLRLLVTITKTWSNQKEALWRTRQQSHGIAIFHRIWATHIKGAIRTKSHGSHHRETFTSHTRDTETGMCSKCTPSSRSTPTDAGRQTHADERRLHRVRSRK